MFYRFYESDSHYQSDDGRFIESSSGTAIYELKRRYDQLAGVGSSVRTPYAITAFVSQHGKPIFRLGSVRAIFVFD
jgi:GDP/GTP exchange factor required for growth at low temperature